nr:unnamed protein product [Callosobruchus analis]
MRDLTSGLLQGQRKIKYGPESRSFAITFHFYFPKGYEYVRRKFNNTLPLTITISKWYSNVNRQPGFTEESKNSLKMKVEEALDKISIRKRVEWDW